jgi:ubiquinone/menaquinone biosynthesis C-methylase UbiE
MIEQIRHDWNQRSRDNSRQYIVSGKPELEERDFSRSGEINVANEIMTDIPRICGANRSPLDLHMVEIGCGVGRMTRMLAKLFGEVTALDVSDEMVSEARSNTQDLPNVRILLGDGATLQPLQSACADFVSFIVFQHIPNFAIVDSYCKEAYRVLRPGGLFKFQVQGDTSIARHPQDTWLGCAISKSQARMLARNAGFTVERTDGAGTQYFWLWFRKRLT